MEWKVAHLAVTDDLFAKMPPAVSTLREEYRPSGQVTITHWYRPEGSGGWRKTYLIQPEGMSAAYHGFPYRVEDITGNLVYAVTNDQHINCTFNLNGTASHRPITVTGFERGDGDTPAAVECEIQGDRIPLDRKLLDALPQATRTVAQQFNPEGYG